MEKKGPGNYVAHLRPHSKVVVGRKKKSKPGVLLLSGSRVGAKGFWSSFFTGEFKTLEQEFKALGSENTSNPSGQLLKASKMKQNEGAWGIGMCLGSLSSLLGRLDGR